MKRKVPDNSNSDLCIQKNTKRKKPNKWIKRHFLMDNKY